MIEMNQVALTATGAATSSERVMSFGKAGYPMTKSFLVHVIVLATAIWASGDARAADNCFRDLGSMDMFGSDDQVRELQEFAKTDCVVAGFTFSTAVRSTLVVADFEDKDLFRLKIDAVSKPWERWSRFDRSDVLKDDPSDGFDLSNFTPSEGAQKPALSDRLQAFIEEHEMQRFMP